MPIDLLEYRLDDALAAQFIVFARSGTLPGQVVRRLRRSLDARDRPRRAPGRGLGDGSATPHWDQPIIRPSETGRP